MSAVQELPFYSSDAEDTHCVQACYQMLVARSKNVDMSVQQAEVETAFSVQRLTWQFEMLLSLAEKHSLYVLNYDALPIEDFITDPLSALREWIDDDEAAHVQIENSDIELEVHRAKQCVRNPRVAFKCGIPTPEELSSECRHGRLVTCVLNGAALLGDDGYRPHSIIVRSLESDTAVIDDPGPPPRPNWMVPANKFVGAWRDPTPALANYIAVSTQPFAEGHIVEQ